LWKGNVQNSCESFSLFVFHASIKEKILALDTFLQSIEFHCNTGRRDSGAVLAAEFRMG
jgi:hypothetical protein